MTVACRNVLLTVCLALAAAACTGREEGPKQPGVLFPIIVNNRYGYINRAGEVVVEPRYTQAACFFEGLARVWVNGKWGYLDAAGKVVIRPQFRQSWKFSEGLARFENDGTFG